MSGGALLAEQLHELLPGDWQTRVAAIRLELTPHRAFRFVLLDGRGDPVAIAHLDEAADRCLPSDPESLGRELKAVLPTVLVRGDLGGRPVCVRPYFQGRSLDGEFGSTGFPSLLRDAQNLLAIVQGERRSEITFDDAEFERFVREPVSLIRGCARFFPEDQARLDSLVEATKALLSRTVQYSLHHGDFQFTNLLRGESGRLQIIDWELSQSQAPIWMDRVHLAISYNAATFGCSYGTAAQKLRADGIADASSLDDGSRRGLFILCVLHGMSHFLRRVPHLAGRRRIDDFLGAGEAFLIL